MRKSIALLFLILLLANGIGFYVFYLLELYQIKKEMRESLKAFPDEKLEILTLTTDQFQNSIVEEGEIRVNGKMYDVARISSNNGVVKIYCLHDAKEDNLFLLLGEIVAKPLDSRHQIPQDVLAYFVLIFIGANVFFLFSMSGADIVRQQYYRIKFPDVSLDVSSPPPRV